MKISIYSYSNEDLNPEISKYQRLVFSKFGLKIHQIIGPKIKKSDHDFDYEDHPTALTNIIKNSTDDFIIFFDVDCVPLSYDFYPKLLKQIEDKKTLAGGIQCASHININKSYISPAFCGFSRQLYLDCGEPSFNTDRTPLLGCDNMQRFTDVCLNLNKNVIYWNVTDGGNNKWDILSHNMKFGNGTIYENLIYHQFEIRLDTYHEEYINKCIQILK